MFSTLKKMWKAAMEAAHEGKAPKWLAEPVRAVANRVAAGAAAVGTLLVTANSLVHFVPVAYRDRVSAVLAAVAAAAALSAKVAGEVLRKKVFSPLTVGHDPETGEVVGHAEPVTPPTWTADDFNSNPVPSTFTVESGTTRQETTMTTPDTAVLQGIYTATPEAPEQ